MKLNVQSVQRLNCSKNGNPRFKIGGFDNDNKVHWYKTKPDAGWAYAITQYNYLGKDFEIELDSKENIISLEEVK